MLSEHYALECRNRVINLVQMSLFSAYFKETAGTGDTCGPYFKIEIMRNQLCFGPHHSQSAFVNLRKLHEIAQVNAFGNMSHSRMASVPEKSLINNSVSRTIKVTKTAEVSVAQKEGVAVKSTVATKLSPNAAARDIHLDFDSGC